MKDYITVTHWMSGDKVHINKANISHIRESKKANVIVTLDGRGMYVTESIEEIEFLMTLEH